MLPRLDLGLWLDFLVDSFVQFYFNMTSFIYLYFVDYATVKFKIFFTWTKILEDFNQTGKLTTFINDQVLQVYQGINVMWSSEEYLQ